MITKDDVVEALHGVGYPELGMDIVELGLYYDAEIAGPNVKIIHSLTSMGCPRGPDDPGEHPRGRRGASGRGAGSKSS